VAWRLRADREAGSAAAAAAARSDRAVEPEPQTVRRARWDLEEGAPIGEGRSVLKRLGGGSRYEVFLVWDERLFALAVAKVLRPDVAADARALRDLAREAELLARLAHPGLVRGFGAVLDGSHPHLLLEHVEGPTLGSLVKRYGALPMDQLLPLALHVVAVLHYLAAEQVVHLDVKPGNVIVGVPPRLIDLSIARPVERAARLREVIGTDAYMAPEQCNPAGSTGEPGPPADVFGLGATLYYAATGRVPFPRAEGARESAEPAVRFPQLVASAEPLPTSLPDAFRQIVLRMLAPRPADRPAPAEIAAVLSPLVAAVPDRLPFSRRRGLVAP
jgi:serine/threonine protein kinase